MYVALLGSALLVGCLLAVQTSVNLQLTRAVGTPYGASTLQLAVAATLLATLASLALDLLGLLGIPRQPVSAGIVLGAVAVLAGITVVIRGQRAGAGVRTGVATPGWVALGLVAGAVLPLQGAVNARLRTDLGQPLAVALISFVVATLAIAVVLVVLLGTNRTPRPRLQPLRTMPWWGWLGGACAASYVTATFLLIPTIGAATTVALTVTGQQLASALIDHNGLFRLARRPLGSARLSGLALLIAGSVLVQLG